MGDEEVTFKVTDRRHRPDLEDAPSGERAGPSAPRPAQPAHASETYGAADRGGGVHLPDIFAMFATSALVNLGEAADPMTGEGRIDLAQARGAIDALMVLRQKTEGNRTPEESRMLEALVHDLQMRYVRVAKGREAP